jgi:hypothetical protein
MPGEDKLISLLSRVELKDNALSLSTNLFKENLDWQYLLKKSREEGVSCLIYQNLRNSPLQESLPENVLESFKNIYYNNAKRNAFIYEKIKKVLGMLAAEKIKTISLKGFFLAENIYQNIALRPMSDIDILIKKDDLPRAVQILHSLGYSTREDYEKVLGRPFSYSLTFFSQHPDDIQALSIDLHWHFLSATWLVGFLFDKIDMERIWSSAEAAQIDGADTLTLSPTHLLLHLAQHGFAHSFEKLIMLTDIRETLRCYQDRLVWDEVIEEAERSGLFNILSYALYLTLKRLGIDESWIADHQFLKKSFSSWVNSSKLPCLTYILLEKSWKDKLKYSLKAAHLLAYLAAKTPQP